MDDYGTRIQPLMRRRKPMPTGKKPRVDDADAPDRPNEMMRLGAFFHPTGNHVAAWLHPEAQIDAGTNFRHYAQITQTAERGKFDLMFVADAVAVRDGRLAALSRWPHIWSTSTR